MYGTDHFVSECKHFNHNNYNFNYKPFDIKTIDRADPEKDEAAIDRRHYRSMCISDFEKQLRALMIGTKVKVIKRCRLKTQFVNLSVAFNDL